MTAWYQLIQEEMDIQGDSFDNLVYCTLDDNELDMESNNDSEERLFMLWTHDRVYFPVNDNGDKWVESVPRHPQQMPI